MLSSLCLSFFIVVSVLFFTFLVGISVLVFVHLLCLSFPAISMISVLVHYFSFPVVLVPKFHILNR